jgi:hypothetical protein
MAASGTLVCSPGKVRGLLCGPCNHAIGPGMTLLGCGVSPTT